MKELERERLLRRRTRFSGRAQTSNAFEFLWHRVFELGGGDTSVTEGVTNKTPPGVTDRSPKESHVEENNVEEVYTDLDYPATNRKKRDSRLESPLCAPGGNQYPRLREALAKYMTLESDQEAIYPTDRQVVDVIDAAEGATEDQVIQCLRYLYHDRRLQPGTGNGPRHFSWFPTVVGDYFQRKRAREHVSHPVTSPAAAQRHQADFGQEQVDAMTEALEVDGAGFASGAG